MAQFSHLFCPSTAPGTRVNRQEQEGRRKSNNSAGHAHMSRERLVRTGSLRETLVGRQSGATGTGGVWGHQETRQLSDEQSSGFVSGGVGHPEPGSLL